MKINKSIKLALAYVNKSEAWLAREFETTPSNFNQRMKNDKFSTEELEKIASILGCTFTASFTFPDGTKIG